MRNPSAPPVATSKEARPGRGKPLLTDARSSVSRSQNPSGESEDPVSLAVCELIARYELGEYRNRPTVQSRLADLFRTNPPDALERLQKAADFLGVTGEHAQELLSQDTQRELTIHLRTQEPRERGNA